MILYQNYAKEIMSKLGRLNELVKHAPSVGTYHENLITSYLSNFLSKRFSVKTGFVYNPKTQAVSPQIDILIIDENVPSAYLFQDGNFAVVVPNAVVSAIEVKTVLNKSSFNDIVKKSVQYRKSNPQGFNLFALCFRSSTKNPKTVADWCTSQGVDDHFLNYPHKIMVLDSFIFDLIIEPLAIPFGLYMTTCNHGVDSKEEAILTQFLFCIMKQCELKAGIHTADTINTIFAGDFDKLFFLHHQAFKFGIGKVPMLELNHVNGENIFRRAVAK
ncbi:TPA: DUF6602 domain-containing protein [Vibrio cholerae]|uniref:DUF6602 domain-containing protein n=1 Tax=Vibrio cholerae TaxID=666 RepID=UPI00163BF622|nr:DUF6602 domain-containing protein [Vibrio cholerae]EJL6271778.1 hypothetical protein [Vibrio cholerae]EJL6845392.1 hypothetical protein [Vibrio cholerae]